jgi:hypothetical protein
MSKSEMRNQGTVTNIWNIKQYRTKQPLSMCFINLQPATNNKDTFNVQYIQQCKMKFEPPKQKWDIAECANCQRYGHRKNHCHLKPRCIKCPGDHLTNQYHRKKDLVVLDVSYAVETIPQITRDVLSTKNYKKGIPITSSETTLLPNKPNLAYKRNQELCMLK